jgi:DNA repair exonuclease SbcCD ATPase subunit
MKKINTIQEVMSLTSLIASGLNRLQKKQEKVSELENLTLKFDADKVTTISKLQSKLAKVSAEPLTLQARITELEAQLEKLRLKKAAIVAENEARVLELQNEIFAVTQTTAKNLAYEISQVKNAEQQAKHDVLSAMTAQIDNVPLVKHPQFPANLFAGNNQFELLKAQIDNHPDYQEDYKIDHIDDQSEPHSMHQHAVGVHPTK